MIIYQLVVSLYLNAVFRVTGGNVAVRQNIGIRQRPILNRWKRGIRQIGIRQKRGVRQILRDSPAFSYSNNVKLRGIRQISFFLANP